jgi:pimeloyl-ACP methyl ester carboxylesterase
VVGAAAAGLLGMAFAYAWQVVRRAQHPDRPSRIISFDPDAVGGPTVTVERHAEAVRPGRFGLWFDDDRGYLRVGDIVGTTRRTVTRRVDLVEFGSPEPGMPCRLTGSYWRNPAAAGLPYEDVAVPTELGEMPAWFIPGDDAEPWRRVVILVHGWRSNRLEPLRAVPAIRSAGWSSLDITYRNDVDAPAGPDGKYHLGATEWRDVEAAMRLAIDRGAERIVLAGWSMGGGTVLQTLLRSELAQRVERIILDSPALDWHAILAAYVRLANYPSPIGPITEGILKGSRSSRLVGLGEPIPMRELAVQNFAARISHSTLLLQGDDDPTTPVAVARWFAAERPDIVEYTEFPGAGHIRAWNSNADLYGATIAAWLSR